MFSDWMQEFLCGEELRKQISKLEIGLIGSFLHRETLD
jgi:hypothetical protein